MDMYDSLFSSKGILDRKVADTVFEVLPESGLAMLIIDKKGNCWQSDPHAVEQIGIDQHFVDQVTEKLGDGDDPLITRLGDNTVVAGELFSGTDGYGYVILALEQYRPDDVLKGSGLVELALNELDMIIRLIERSELLAKMFSAGSGCHDYQTTNPVFN